MSVYLGVDIGTYESKGVLVDRQGAVLASAARPHGLIVPRAGWAEHRAEEDWWADFVWLARKLIAESGLAPSEIKGIGASAIGPCMLPVDSDGAPLMNAVLYGVDTRAAREIEELTASIGAETIFTRCGNALTSQSVGPKISLAEAQPAGHLRARPQVSQFDLLPRSPPDGPFRHRSLHRSPRQPALSDRRANLERRSGAGVHGTGSVAGTRLDDRSRGRRHSARRRTNWPPARDAGHRRHDRRRGRGDQRRRSRLRRHDVDVRFDDFHHPHRRKASKRRSPLACAMAVSRPPGLHGGVGDQRNLDPLVCRPTRPRSESAVRDD